MLFVCQRRSAFYAPKSDGVARPASSSRRTIFASSSGMSRDDVASSRRDVLHEIDERGESVSVGGRADTRLRMLRRAALLAGVLVLVALPSRERSHWILGLIGAAAAVGSGASCRPAPCASRTRYASKSMRMTTRRNVGRLTSVNRALVKALRLPTLSSPGMTSRPAWANSSGSPLLVARAPRATVRSRRRRTRGRSADPPPPETGATNTSPPNTHRSSRSCPRCGAVPRNASLQQEARVRRARRPGNQPTGSPSVNAISPVCSSGRLGWPQFVWMRSRRLSSAAPTERHDSPAGTPVALALASRRIAASAEDGLQVVPSLLSPRWQGRP